MQNVTDFDQRVQAVLDMIGGEPLTDSGFESEEPEPECNSEQEG